MNNYRPIYAGDGTSYQKSNIERQLKHFSEHFGEDVNSPECIHLIKKRSQVIELLEEFQAMLNYDSGKPLRFSDTQQFVTVSENKELVLKIQIKGLQEELSLIDSLLSNYLYREEH